VIELNPRYWMQNHLATVAGINFPLIQYLDLTDSESIVRTSYEDDLRWQDVWLDYLSMRSNAGEDRESRGLFIRSLTRADCHSTFALDDPVPSMRSIASIIGDVANRSIRLKH